MENKKFRGIVKKSDGEELIRVEGDLDRVKNVIEIEIKKLQDSKNCCIDINLEKLDNEKLTLELSEEEARTLYGLLDMEIYNIEHNETGYREEKGTFDKIRDRLGEKLDKNQEGETHEE